MNEQLTTPLIELIKVSRTFDEGLAGVRDIDLTVWPGDFVAIVGPSGAGKSTLLNLLGLLDKPDVGTYLFNGLDIATLRENQRDKIRGLGIGFVFQSSFVLGDESSLSNAELGLRTNRFPYRTRAELASRALRLLRIQNRATTRARLLSGGERQRLAIARAIATQPELLLADEPTGNLDTANSDAVIRHLTELNAMGTTVVIITHDEQIAASAHRTITIIDGAITSDTNADSSVRTHRTSTPRAAQTARAGLVSAWLDDVGDALSAISRRLARSALLVLAFTLGIAGMVMSLGVTESAADQVTQRISAAALDHVRVLVPGGNDLLDPGDTRLDDWIDRVSKLPHVESVGYVATVGAESAQVRRLGANDSPPNGEYYVMSASAEYLHDQGVDIGESPIRMLDGTLTGSAWVGDAAMSELGIAQPGPGSSIWIAGNRINVAGTLHVGDERSSLNRTIIVSEDVLRAIPGASIVLDVKTEYGFPAALADAIPLALSPDNPGRFAIETVADLRSLRFGVSNDLGTFVAALAAILLALATVSASTAMYLSVQARTPEIALRRAIGANRTAVARLFIIEGMIIGLIGGAIGGFLGTIAAITAANAQGWTPIVPTTLAALAPALGALTGLVSGLLPALSASRKDPATAIR